MDNSNTERVSIVDQNENQTNAVITRKSLYFDGAATMVEIPDSSAYSWATTSALSVSAWINPDASVFPDTEGTGYVHWLSKLDTNANEWTFRLYSADNTDIPSRSNRLSFYVYSSNGLPQGDGVATQVGIAPGFWTHVVGTINSSQLIKLYKDGYFKDSFTTALTLTDTSTPVRIGSGAQNANPANRSYFKGYIRDVQIYNKELTSSEVLQINSGTKPSGLVASFPLNEGTGTTAFDLISGNNGTINSGTWV